MVCKYYLPRYVCRVYAWLGCRVTESRVIRGCMARLETRCAGGRERGWKAEANSPSFYPILESECLAPLTLETGCTAGSYTHTRAPHFPFHPCLFRHHTTTTNLLFLLLSPLLCPVFFSGIGFSFCISFAPHPLSTLLPTFQPGPSTYAER